MDSNGYFIGLDLGQRQDFSAIALVHRCESRAFGLDWVRYSHADSHRAITYHLRHLERLPLGTPYSEVVERMRAITANPALAGRCSLAVDATGVGGPVVERLLEARLPCELVPVTITAGDQPGRHGAMRTVPKTDLIVGLQIMLNDRELRIADALPLGRVLRDELLGIRATQRWSGHTQYGAGRQGEHDDLVLAVALACWRASSRSAGEMNEGRLI